MSNHSLASHASSEPRPETPPSNFPILPYREEGSLWAWTAYDRIPEFVSTKNTIRGISCYQYAPPLIDPEISKVDLTEEELEVWLETPAPLKEGKQHCGGYKILQVDNEHGPGIIPLKPESFEIINKALGIPPVELHILTTYQGVCGMFPQDDGSFIFIRKNINVRDTFSSALRYDPATNFTTGCIRTSFHYANATMIFTHIRHQFLACPHPLLIPILMTELDCHSSMANILYSEANLIEIERETGFTAIDHRSNKPKTRNYQPLIKKMGDVHAYYSRYQTVILSAKLVTQSHMKQLQRLDQCLPDETKQKLAQYSMKLSDRLDYLLSSIEHAALHANIPTRLQSQQAVLFNLIAQADNDINIGLSKDTKELAVASKRDSSAMKIIAFLTTLFLPGTFVASFVAMPLFNWEAPTISQATTSHFWIYWAITGPLTLVTMTIVLSWAFLHGRKTQDLIRLARKASDRKLVDVESGSTDEKSEDKVRR